MYLASALESSSGQLLSTLAVVSSTRPFRTTYPYALSLLKPALYELRLSVPNMTATPSIFARDLISTSFWAVM